LLLYVDSPDASLQSLRSLILLGPTLTGKIDETRSLQGSNDQYQEASRIITQTLTQGRNILIFNDSAGYDPLHFYQNFTPPTNSGAGNYCYVDSPHIGHTQPGGISNNVDIQNLILLWDQNPSESTCQSIQSYGK
jgi:hypothetical protein